MRPAQNARDNETLPVAHDGDRDASMRPAQNARDNLGVLPLVKVGA